MIGQTEVTINTDVVESDIPLLLSRDSMKKANMNLNFESDTITAFGEKSPLITTTSGHYAIPIAKPVHLANKLEKAPYRASHCRHPQIGLTERSP